jgi:hypothetical protein
MAILPSPTPLDTRLKADVSGAEHARQADLQGERLARKLPGGEFAPGADIAACIPLQLAWEP